MAELLQKTQKKHAHNMPKTVKLRGIASICNNLSLTALN